MHTLRDYTFRELVTSPPNETVYDAATRMDNKQVGCVLVMSDGKIFGIATRYDFVHHIIAEGRNAKTTEIKDIMHASPVSVESSVTIAEALRTMIERKVERLVVRSGQQILGVVSLEDIVSKLEATDTLKALSSEKYNQIHSMVKRLTPFLVARYDGPEKEEVERELNDEVKALLRLLEEVEVSLRP